MGLAFLSPSHSESSPAPWWEETVLVSRGKVLQGLPAAQFPGEAGREPSGTWPHTPCGALSPSSHRGACIQGMKARPERAASQGPRSLTFCVSTRTMGTFLCQMLSVTVLPVLPPPLTLPAVSLWFSFVQRVWVRRVNLARFAGQTTATSSPPWLLSNSTSFSQDLPTGTPPPFCPSVSRIGTGWVLLSPPAPGPLFRERSSSQVWHWSPFPCCCF